MNTNKKFIVVECRLCHSGLWWISLVYYEISLQLIVNRGCDLSSFVNAKKAFHEVNCNYITPTDKVLCGVAIRCINNISRKKYVARKLVVST